MCLISQEVEKVHDTNLFCGLSSDKKRQITIYSNKVNNISQNNAMILPVPFPKTVKFHDMSNYKDFFNDCESCFEKMYDEYATLGRSYGTMSMTNSSEPLKVFSVGSYNVSLAMTLDDLKRVNKNVFALSDGITNVLKKYNKNFGFIICKLKDGNEQYHPFAYSHEIASEKVFIPTKHYHKEHKTSNSNNYFSQYGLLGSNFQLSPDNLEADDWDHNIYLYNVSVNNNFDVKTMDSSKYIWNKKVNINFKKLLAPLDKTCRSFQKLQISGRHKNVDIVLSVLTDRQNNIL